MYNGVLVVNLGSPRSPSVSDIRSYLKEFLMDPYVLNIPTPLRYALVYGIILPFRPKKTLHAYQSIWTQEGSPLIINTRKFATKLQKELSAPVEIAMRYGDPSFQEALSSFHKKGLYNIKVILMYPQYALSTTLTAQKRLEELNSSQFSSQFNFDYIRDFYSHPGFINSVSNICKKNLEPDTHLLMSFHGLPWSHLGKAVQAENCKKENCCDKITEKNNHCYRAQSFETARLIAQALKLSKDQWSIGFQSRLTRGWIEPFTDVVTEELVKKRGIKKLAVVCPSFTADCLETLEEIEIREKEAFLEHGGESLSYIPCVNDDSEFVKSIAQTL